MELDIREDDLSEPALRALLAEHLTEMHRITPPGSVRALDLSALEAADITLWSAWHEGAMVGCGALKELDASHAEIKSMHTAARCRGMGVGTRLLRHLIHEARSRGYRTLSLETGSTPYFESARALYAGFGFQPCGPFGEYTSDLHSFFMSRPL